MASLRWRTVSTIAVCGTHEPIPRCMLCPSLHAVYLARGGSDFILGDGRLRYGPEVVSESYYSAQIVPWLFATADLKHVTNPAYNLDRGPVWVASLRLHVETEKK